MNLNKLLACILIALTLTVVTGCGSREEQEQVVSASELYEKARRSMRNGAYDRSIILYRQLQSRFPFGRYAEQAQLELAYSYYKNFEPELALSTLDRFIRTYPTHPSVDYAYYLKGLVNFNRNVGFLTRLLAVETLGRDQEFSRQSFLDFSELLQRFPDSKYADDARKRMLYLRDAMAAYELTVAEYYLRREAYIAAANRAQFVVENFQETSHAGNALAIMAEAYEELELSQLSTDAERVLEMNYPRHPHLSGRSQEDESWLNKLWPFD